MAGVGVVLSGGGARGAYEAGVLAWVLDEAAKLPKDWRLHAACGTSVGAIHTAFLGAALSDPKGASERLQAVWNTLSVDDILPLGMRQFVSGWRVVMGGNRPGSVFDARALSRLVSNAIPWPKIRESIASGRLQAMTVTATHVPTGRPVAFLDACPGVTAPPGVGHRLKVEPASIGPNHVLASAAIPFVFPPVPVGADLYCDGGLRLNTPMGPAIRLGADKLFVIALNTETQGPPEIRQGRYPGAPFLLGKMLNAFLLDHVAQDIENLTRVNEILDDGERSSPGFLKRLETYARAHGKPVHRHIDSLVVRPSENLGVIAGDELRRMRVGVRRGAIATTLLKLLDTGEGMGSDVASYLLFDRVYARDLLELGRADAAAQGDEIRAFLFDS